MPETTMKRSVPPIEPEDIPEPIQSTTILVIHPGSQTLRFGRASDPFPVSIPNCIARRHKRSGQKRYEDPWLIKKEAQADAKQQQKVALKQAEEALLSRPTSQGEYRQPTSHKQLQSENCIEKAELTDVMSYEEWTPTDLKPAVLIGREAQYVHPSDCYSLHWPVKRGCLNIHSGTGGSLTSVLADLETIISTALRTHLDLSLQALEQYKAVLLIPDIFDYHHAKEMMTLLLNRLGFGAAVIIQESVCATFGSGVGTACVVDIGDEKTSICCVEDGLSHKNTRLRMDYGGSDITRSFHWLLSRAGFPIRDIKLDSLIDGLFLQELKESYCHLDQDTEGVYDQHIQLKRPHKYIQKYNMKIGDEAILAPLALFFPDMFACQGPQLIHKQQRCDGLPEDPNDEFYLRQTSRSYTTAEGRGKRKDALEAASLGVDSSFTQNEDTQLSQPIGDEDDNDPLAEAGEGGADLLTSGRSKADLEEEIEEKQVLQLMGLDQAVIHSIEKCDGDEMKKRMYSCIVVVGGGLMFAGAYSWLQHRVWALMPPQARVGLEVMDVITRPKDMDPRMTCWKGAAILASLDTAQELWIKPEEWKQFGAKVLRERSPFMW